MNIRYCIEKVEEIKREAICDCENAHGIEDGLYIDFVKHLKDLHITNLRDIEDIKTMASIISKSQEINYPRHCA